MGGFVFPNLKPKQTYSLKYFLSVWVEKSKEVSELVLASGQSKTCTINNTPTLPSKILQPRLLSPKEEIAFGIQSPTKGDLGQMVQHVQNDKGDALS